MTRSAAAVDASPGSGNDTIRVVIADDHVVARHGLRRMLDGSGIEIVGEAETGLRAVQLVRELHPHVVLMDMRMPEMDGLQATLAIAEEAPQTCVIILSGYESMEDLGQALEAGARGYLNKSSTPEVVIGAIRLVVAGGSVIDTDLLRELLRRKEPAGPYRKTTTELTLDSFSHLQREVLKGIVAGRTNKEIAKELGYSVASVKSAVQRIIEKLGVSDRTQAAVWAVGAGIHPPADQ